MNIAHITLLDVLELHEGCGLPTPVQLFVTDVPHRFITRFEAIQREVAAAEARESGRNSAEAEEAGAGGDEGVYEEVGDETIEDEGEGGGEVEGEDGEGAEAYEYGDDDILEEDEYPDAPVGVQAEAEAEAQAQTQAHAGGGDAEAGGEFILDWTDLTEEHDGAEYDADAAGGGEYNAEAEIEVEVQARADAQGGPAAEVETEAGVEAEVAEDVEQVEDQEITAEDEDQEIAAEDVDQEITAAKTAPEPTAPAADDADHRDVAEFDDDDTFGIDDGIDAIGEAALAASASVYPEGAEAGAQAQVEGEDGPELAQDAIDVAVEITDEDADEYGIDDIADQAVAASADGEFECHVRN
jgi:hypothetical protein